MKLVVVVGLLIGCQQGSIPAPAKSDVIGPAPKLTIVTPPFDVPPPADKVIAIGRGVQHACVVRASGAVDCWGQPRACSHCPAPTPPDDRVRRNPEITDAVAISPGARCFVRRTGEVECLDIETGKLAPVAGLDHVRAATDDGCYLLDSGGVRCIDDAGVHAIKDVHDAIQIAASHRAVCIVRKDRTLACGTRFGPLAAVVKVAQVRALTMIGSEDAMVCVLAAQSRCFAIDVDKPGPIEPVGDRMPVVDPRATQLAIGLTGYGDLHYEVDALVAGKVVTGDTTLPVLGDATLLAAGCAVRATGAVACWGDNRGGVLAQPTTIGHMDVAATPVPGITDIVAVGAGLTETWALTRDGRALHWGDMGDGAVVREPTEVHFGDAGFGSEKLVELAVAPSGQACVRGELGHAWCQYGDRVRTIAKLPTTGITHIWLRNADLAVVDHADGSREYAGPLRGPVDTLDKAGPDDAVDIQVILTSAVTCRRSAVGSITCEPRSTPMSQLAGATSLVAGNVAACAIVQGRVMCWAVEQQTHTVDSVMAATSIAVGNDVGCALDAGRVLCWPFTPDGVPGKPTPVIASNAVSISLGGGARDQWLRARTEIDGPRPAGNYGCAVMLDHTVQCWGANLAGELLDSSFRSTSTPIGIRLD